MKQLKLNELCGESVGEKERTRAYRAIKQEVAIIQKLQHPNIIRFKEHFIENVTILQEMNEEHHTTQIND